MDDRRPALEALAERLDDLAARVEEIRLLLRAELDRPDPVPATPEPTPAPTPVVNAYFDEAELPRLSDFEPVAPLEPKAADEEAAFEPVLDFDLKNTLSLADSFFYAGEFFGGNTAEVETMLDEIEHLSGMTQVENYLFDVRGFSKEDPAVQRLLTFVIAHAKTRS